MPLQNPSTINPQKLMAFRAEASVTSTDKLFSVTENLKRDLLKAENRNYPGDDPRLSPLEAVFARHSYKWERISQQMHHGPSHHKTQNKIIWEEERASAHSPHRRGTRRDKSIVTTPDHDEVEAVALESAPHRLLGGRRSMSSLTKSLRPLRSAGGGTKQTPVPVCSGMCCSGNAPNIPDGAPAMTSLWQSNQMAQGAQVQIRSKAFGTWWRPARGRLWTSLVSAFNTTQPQATVFLKINRIDGRSVQFKTPSNTYVRASRTLKFGSNYLMDTTTDGSDPYTVFTIEFQTGSPFIAIRAADNLFISNDGNRLMRWATTVSDWELWAAWEVMRVPAIRGVNLGGWLVFEQWMNPKGPTFSPNPLDGTAFRFKSVKGKYITAPGGGGSNLKTNENSESVNQIFHIRTTHGPTAPYIWNIMVQNFQWWQILPGSNNVWATTTAKDPPTDGSANFECLWDNKGKFAVIRAPNGKFLRATSDGGLVADFEGNIADPSIWNSAASFETIWISWINTDWQLARSAGKRARTVLDSMRQQFIVEADWKYMQEQKINAVRVPVGYWIFDKLNVGSVIPAGTLSFLDWAFSMGAKYNVRIWFSVHAAPGSQGGSNGRDGMVKWGAFDTVNQTLSLVNFLASRYATNPMWLGMGLLNEPVVPGFNGVKGVEKETLLDYYTRAYDVVRYYSPCAYISMEGRVWSSPWEVHWLMWDVWHTNLMMETHIYDVFDTVTFAKMTPQQEVQYVQKTRASQIRDLQYYGRALLVGEWSNAMAKFPPQSDTETVKNFARAQLQAFAASKSGWFFWSFRINNTGTEHWDWHKSKAKGWLPQKADGNWW